MNLDRHDLFARFGLKWNPFAPQVPVSALWQPAAIEQFCWRMQAQVREGGFALITGEPGTGKSAALRVLASQLGSIPDLRVLPITRPQSIISDFYRELGALCGVTFNPHNRWAGFRILREIWLNHLQTTRMRPVLLIDEAQQMQNAVLAELRILASTEFDSKTIATIVLCGDQQLVQRFRSPELLPIASRIRVRLLLRNLEPKEMLDWLKYVLDQAGAPHLITQEVMATLSQNNAGNLRALANSANELLAAAARKDLSQIDEKLYLETFDRARNPN
jgi:type II secretory pathway predicted ATPase ExeA